MPDLVFNMTDRRPLALPLLYYANDLMLSDTNITTENWTAHAIMHPDLTRDQIMKDALNKSQYFVQWIQLPQEKFNGSSIGAAILLPKTQNLSREQSWPQTMILCNFAAAWGTTTLQVNIAETAIDDRVSSKVDNSDKWNLRNTTYDTASLYSESGTDLVYWDYPRYPQKKISIAQAWAQSLNPMVESLNKTVFQLLMQEKLDVQGSEYIWASTATFKEALTLMISNGLGRVRFNSTFQGTPKSITTPDGTSWIDGNYWLSGKGNVFTVDPEDAKEWVQFSCGFEAQGLCIQH